MTLFRFEHWTLHARGNRASHWTAGIVARSLRFGTTYSESPRQGRADRSTRYVASRSAARKATNSRGGVQLTGKATKGEENRSSGETANLTRQQEAEQDGGDGEEAKDTKFVTDSPRDATQETEGGDDRSTARDTWGL